MEIPKNLEYALQHRCSYALQLMKYDNEVVRILKNLGIRVSLDDIQGGSEMINNPLASMERIMEAVENAKPSDLGGKK